VMLLGGEPTSRSESRSLSMHVDVEEMERLRSEIAALEKELGSGE
jgi:hypothetical protein